MTARVLTIVRIMSWKQVQKLCPSLITFMQTHFDAHGLNLTGLTVLHTDGPRSLKGRKLPSLVADYLMMTGSKGGQCLEPVLVPSLEPLIAA